MWKQMEVGFWWIDYFDTKATTEYPYPSTSNFYSTTVTTYSLQNVYISYLLTLRQDKRAICERFSGVYFFAFLPKIETNTTGIILPSSLQLLRTWFWAYSFVCTTQKAEARLIVETPQEIESISCLLYKDGGSKRGYPLSKMIDW